MCWHRLGEQKQAPVVQTKARNVARQNSIKKEDLQRKPKESQKTQVQNATRSNWNASRATSNPPVLAQTRREPEVAPATTNEDEELARLMEKKRELEERHRDLDKQIDLELEKNKSMSEVE